MHLTVAVFKTASSWPLYVVVEKGLLRRDGVSIEVVHVKSSIQQFRGLVDGDYDLGHTLMDNVVAYDEHMGAFDVKKPDFAAFMGGDAGQASLVARRGINSIRGLKGKVLGVDAPSTGLAIVLLQILRESGLKRSDFRLVSVGGTDLRMEAMAAETVDACMLNPPFDLIAQKRGLRLLASSREFVAPYEGTVGVARLSRLKEIRAIVRKYVRAYASAGLWLFNPSNRAEAGRILSERIGLKESEATLCYDEVIDPREGISPCASLSLRGIKSVINLRWDVTGVRRKRPSPEEFVDLGLYYEALS